MEAPSQKPQPNKAAVFFSRFGSTVFLWGLLTAVFFFRSPPAFLAILSVLILISTIEFFKMLRKVDIPCFPRFGLLLAIAYCAVTSWGFYTGAKEIDPAIDAFFIFLAVAGSFILQLRFPIKGTEALLSVAATALGFLYIAYLFTFTARITFGVAGDVAAPGAFVLLWLIAVTKFTDMGAYLTGSLFGKNKMIPHVSPGKTWEGFYGAILFSQIAACGLYALMPGELNALYSWQHVIAPRANFSYSCCSW